VLDGAMTSAPQHTADLLGDAAQRLTRTVDGLHDDGWSAPSLLPSWTRAHVVAHLALNAEGMARALRGVVAHDGEHEPRTMYDSDEQRDADIAQLATADPSELRDRLLAGTTELNDAMAWVPASGWEGRVERTPGGRSMPTAALPGMRLREVEIHHVDLDAGYSRSEWSLDFAVLLLKAMARRLRPDPAFEVKPFDSDRTWVVGSDESEYPVSVVTGPAADLGWWLTGRPAPDTVSCSHGDLPEIGAW
jgi:maleylpyruvate isomerase